MDAPDPSGPEAEAGLTGTHDRRRVVARPSAPRLPHPGPGVEGPPLRGPLMGMPSGHVEQLTRLRRHRQSGQQVGDLVVVGAEVAHLGTDPDQSAGPADAAQPHRPGGAVRPVRRPGGLDAVFDPIEGHRPRASAGSAAEQPRSAEPPRRVLRQERDRCLRADRRVDVGRCQRDLQFIQRLGRHVAEVGSPVQHARQGGVVQTRDHARPTEAQVEHGRHGRGGSHGVPPVRCSRSISARG